MTLKDLEAPPPPVRLRTVAYAPNVDPTELQVQFEYGASQHQQSPDVAKFNVYWVPDSPSARLRVRIDDVDTEKLADDRRMHTLRVIDLRDAGGAALPLSELEKMEGGILTNALSTADPPLPGTAAKPAAPVCG